MSVTISVERGHLVAFAIAFLLIAGMFGAGGAWAAGSFSDVPPSHTFADEIYWAADHDIVNGYADGTFRPGDAVTRQAAVAFQSRYNDSIETVVNTINPTPWVGFTMSATCPEGSRPIAGGGTTSDANFLISGSYPSGDTWNVRFTSRTGASIDATTATAYVTCAPDLAD